MSAIGSSDKSLRRCRWQRKQGCFGEMPRLADTIMPRSRGMTGANIGISEVRKMARAGRLNNIRNRAAEAVNNALSY